MLFGDVEYVCIPGVVWVFDAVRRGIQSIDPYLSGSFNYKFTGTTKPHVHLTAEALI